MIIIGPFGSITVPFGILEIFSFFLIVTDFKLCFFAFFDLADFLAGNIFPAFSMLSTRFSIIGMSTAPAKSDSLTGTKSCLMACSP